jgi:hypothetical protein
MTPYALAKAAGFSQSYISRFKAEEYLQPSQHNIIAIGSVLADRFEGQKQQNVFGYCNQGLMAAGYLPSIGTPDRRMMDAAPDLLEACQTVFFQCQANRPMGERLELIEETVRRAIAKATEREVCDA